MRDPTEAAQTAQDDEPQDWPDVLAYVREATKDVIPGESRDGQEAAA